jgi:hypothetical protein
MRRHPDSAAGLAAMVYHMVLMRLLPSVPTVLKQEGRT